MKEKKQVYIERVEGVSFFQKFCRVLGFFGFILQILGGDWIQGVDLVFFSGSFEFLDVFFVLLGLILIF